MQENRFHHIGTGLTKLCSALLGLAGLAMIAVTIYLCVSCRGINPILISTPDAATETVIALMDTVCDGDFEQAEEYFLGTVDFGAERDPQNIVGSLVWQKYVSTLEYEPTGECYTTEHGLAQNILLTRLDMDSIFGTLRERSLGLLALRVDQAESVSDIYDENNEYRTDVVEEVLREAVEAAIREDARFETIELVLNLKYQDGKWLVVADNILIDSLFGGILF